MGKTISQKHNGYAMAMIDVGEMKSIFSLLHAVPYDKSQQSVSCNTATAKKFQCQNIQRCTNVARKDWN